MTDSRLPWKLLLGLMLVLSLSATARAADRKLTVQGGPNDLGETPIIVAVPGKPAVGPYRLVPAKGDPLNAQIYVEGDTSYLGAVLPSIKKQAVDEYRIEPAGDLDGPKVGVRFTVTPLTIDIKLNGEPLTTHHLDIGPKPILYPLYGPTGAPITRAYPMKDVHGEDKDHPHHRSFWFTHGSVNGVDFWSELKGHGTIKETARLTVIDGPALGRIRTTDDWVAPDGHVVCSDERTLTFYNTKHGRVLDFEITITATHGAVTFDDTKEGMFGLRVASSMDAKPPALGKITNAEGLTNDDTWGKASPWVDYVGPVDGKTVGIAIMNRRPSLRYPTTWHVRTYGLFAANPFGYKDFGLKIDGSYTIPPGKSIRFLYRGLLHEGDTASARVAERFRSYTEGPAVNVVPE